MIASTWWPIAERLRRDERRLETMLLIAVNGLNVADAILTEIGIRSGRVAELNPLVSDMGSLGKIALVGLLSLALYRLRPRALVWSTVPLAIVVAYHAYGALLAL
jgi:hypothetical protein